ncbi:MAG: hypothetical protein QXX41_12775 [Nitrososphaerota archaeon]
MEKICTRVNIDVGVWRAFKAKALLSGRTVSEYLEEVIKREVGAHEENKSATCNKDE